MTAAINLLPPEISQKRKSERVMIYLVLGIILFIGLLAVIYGLTWVRVTQVKRKVEALDAESARLQTQLAKPEYKKAEKKKNELTARESIMNQALAGEVKWHLIFNEVSMVIPSDVWLISFDGEMTASKSEVKCKGYTSDEHWSVAEWLDRLEEVKEWANIWLTYSQKSTLHDQPVVEFETTGGFKGATPSPTVGTSAPSQGKGSEGK